MKLFKLYNQVSTPQEYQDKCRAEIRTVVGTAKPNLDHMKDLPFTQAMLTEIQRVACVAPATLLHLTKDTYNHQEWKLI